ncbi:deoxyribonuclease IV, partial [Acidobacteria bacterium AH-259-D05]|nr:deoxyribonuclease IV [Acidobacteria bacterium AH-259-D05]
HMSIAGGTPLALERAQQAGCRVLQIFVKNNNRWQGKPLSEEEVESFRESRAQSRIGEVVAHDCYLINLASPRDELWQRSIEALMNELERCQRLGLSFLITHPGAHMGTGERQGIARIAHAIDQIHESGDWKVPIALETTAGQGTTLGYQFEHLRDIIASVHHPERVAVCMDTCHIFAAGYDIREEAEYLRIMEKFEQVVGCEKLRVFHFNDSKRELGSRVDRHEHIGRGHIGTSGFAWILNDERFTSVPKILETPKGKTHREDKRNLRVLRSLVKKASG